MQRIVCPDRAVDKMEVPRMTHVPVMLAEVVAVLEPRPGRILVDATFGGGGYSRALLAAGSRVIGIDRDPEAVQRGRNLAAEEPRFTMLAGAFGNLEALLAEAGVTTVDGIVFDLGLSSFQLEDAERGFAFTRDGPLDMRMAGEGPSAADLVNSLEAEELARILHRYGEEPAARRIARAIVARRRTRPLTRTAELAELVARVAGGRQRRHHPATRTFQALRIAVNDELGELERGLEAALRVLAPGGRLVVVAFHSLEDRLVKRFLDLHSGYRAGTSRHRPEPPRARPLLAPCGRRVIRPGSEEVARNPRARSARMRVARKLDAEEGEAEPHGWRRAA